MPERFTTHNVQEDTVSKSIHPNLTADQRAERRARRAPRPPVRRTGTRAGVLAVELRETDEEA